MDWCHPAVNVINQASTKTTFSCCLLIRTTSIQRTTCSLYNFIHKIFAKFMTFCRALFLLLNFRISLLFFIIHHLIMLLLLFSSFFFILCISLITRQLTGPCFFFLLCFALVCFNVSGLNDVISNQPNWYTTHKK